MDKSKKQTPRRYSDSELSFIKNLFAENEGLLMALRKVLLQGSTTKEELEIVQKLPEEAIRLLRKTLLPQIDTDAPFFQMTDMWMNIDTKEKSPEQVYPTILARQIVVNYLTQMLDVVSLTSNKPTVVLAELVNIIGFSPEEVFTRISARNTILQHVDFQLFQLKMLAGTKEETVEETMERISKDSSK